MGCAAPNPLHWRDLRERPRDEILAKAGVSAMDGAYELGFLDGRFRIDSVSERAEELSPEPGRPLSQELQILLIRYLTTPMPGGLTGMEVTEKELPGGATFFRGPHALPVQALLARFGRDPRAFLARCRQVGAKPVDHGDAAALLWPFHETPVTLILWQADDEFEAQITASFDRSISRWFELDMIFLLVRQLANWLADRGDA